MNEKHDNVLVSLAIYEKQVEDTLSSCYVYVIYRGRV